MAGIGFILIIIGFGSLILEQFNITFKIIAWAQQWQPWVGIIVGAIGVLLVIADFLTNREEEAVTNSPRDDYQDPRQGYGDPRNEVNSDPRNDAYRQEGARSVEETSTTTYSDPARGTHTTTSYSERTVGEGSARPQRAVDPNNPNGTV